ncbi:MAG: Na/Pi cotransporter family protein, partial [Clostridia bacterium]|nr:Na/Pi cotransporter family protein [Clostridia bacterium]
MSIFSILTMIGGLAFFLFGMNIMSSNLEKVAGGKLEVILQKLTSNIWKSLALGAAITIAIQSSSALTVMLVGLVNSGIMELGNTVGVIMGADIGTTLTAWILSLSGIQSDNIFMSLLKPQNFSPIVALIGVGLIMQGKKQRQKDIGAILCGFAVLMFGMNLMSQAVEPLAESDQFTSLLTAFSNPILGLLIGTVFTGIIQSSAASIGILQALSLTGAITYGAAIPLIIGLNIGTCMTALLSSIGVSTDAKRVSGIHIAIKVIGAFIAFIPFFLIRELTDIPLFSQTINPVQIAMVHSIYNIALVLIMLPFNQLIVKLVKKIVRGKKGEEEERPRVLIDERLFNSPNIVVNQCKENTIEMAHLAYDSFSTSLSAFEEYDEDKMENINKWEKKLDVLEDELNSILIRLSARPLTDTINNEVNEILYCIREFERIGDYGVNMVNNAKNMIERKVVFSENATKEIQVLNSAIRQIL